MALLEKETKDFPFDRIHQLVLTDPVTVVRWIKCDKKEVPDLLVDYGEPDILFIDAKLFDGNKIAILKAMKIRVKVFMMKEQEICSCDSEIGPTGEIEIKEIAHEQESRNRTNVLW